MLLTRTLDADSLSNASYHEHLSVDRSDRYLAILNLSVLPDYQGHGIAGHLLDQAYQIAKENGFNEVRLDCKDQLVPFYEKNGFTNLGLSESKFGTIDWHNMSKKI